MSAVQIYQITLSGTIDYASAMSEDWQKLITALKEAEGLTSVYWSLQEEDTKQASIVANFPSLDAQKKWASSKQHESAAKLLKAVSSGDIYDNVVVMADDAEPSLSAKTVELVSWIFPSQKVPSVEKKMADGFLKFASSISPSKWSSGGMVAGWSVDVFTHQGEESRRFTGLIGWQSSAAHYECKKTPTFTDYIDYLEHGHSGIEMAHYDYSKHKA